MFNIDEMALILNSLPDPAFILSRSGKYVAVFGGRDLRYYHDGSNLVGLNIQDVVNTTKANWFLEQIAMALTAKTLLVEEYELGVLDIKGIPQQGPAEPIWFEGRIQALDYLVDGEEVVLWVASNITKRHELEIDLRKCSDTDQLTGLFNRRRLDRELNINFDKFQNQSIPSSILMFDLDHLKVINDTLGHHAGDNVISAAADVCRSELRNTDVACRYGGDEFVVVLPNTNLEHAVRFANRFREHINTALSSYSNNGLSLSASIGVATALASDICREQVLKRADQALYTAKEKGKNCVVSG